jgi:alginate O-acetyltransferase complex protein AlgI
MVFSSTVFLFAFLPVTLAIYFAVPDRWTNAVLITASLAFYTWGAGWFVIVLVGTAFADHLIARRISAALRTGGERAANRWTAAAVILNLGVLGWFKYAAFGTRILNRALGAVGVEGFTVPKVLLPLAISFYTFQLISYVADVRRGLVTPVDRFGELLLLVCLFPHLIAGPIVRFAQLQDELRARHRTLDGFAGGVVRFTHGLAKKVLVADVVAQVADAAFNANPDQLSGSVAAIGVLAYTLQIYFDFSGYSDMAIGLAAMLGFHFPENFNRPYSAVTVTDFWRRWHMSLSTWFRDYLYIPLGGNQRGELVTLRNLLLVFFVTGLWHGAAATFVVWGLYHGAWLLIERVTGLRRLPRSLPGVIVRRAATAAIVMVGWVFFRAPTLSDATGYLSALFAGWGRPTLPQLDAVLDHRTTLTLLVASAVFLIPPSWSTPRFLAASTPRAAAWRMALVGVGLPLAVIFVAAGSFSPFLYFRF